jgi:hypothetical protein
VKRVVSSLVMAVLLAGCSTPVSEAPREPTDDASAEIPLRDPDQSAPGPCDVATERAMTDAIGTQIDALSAGDFAAAYEMAAPAFQLSVPLDVFQVVILEGYASLLEARSHSLSDCVTFPNDLANTVVTVTTQSGAVVTYYYEMIDTEEGWRVLGAAEIAPVTSGA